VTATFVLGIDGGSWRILNSLDLPAFDRLTAGATTGTLRSTYPPITFPAWKCYSTGKNPGQLGVFGFSNFDREQRTNRGNDASDFDSAEMWDYLSSAGNRVGVVNMPTTYPPHDLNGVMIAGPNAGEDGYVTPENREKEIEELGYQRLTSGHRLAFKSGGNKAVSAAEEIIGSRFDVTRKLLQRESFDFFHLTLYCTDTIQHYYWNKPELADVYTRIDQQLNTLLDTLAEDDKEWNVVLVSDHGFQPINGAVYLDTWLEQEGFLQRADSPDDSSHSLKQSVGLTTENAYRLVETIGLERVIQQLPDSLVKRIGNSLPSAASTPVVDTVDWETSDAVFLHGGIYVLDRKRREDVIERLLEAIDGFEDTDGRRVINEVYRSENVYNGLYASLGPDLIPITNDYKPLGFASSGELFDLNDDWLASHEMEGVFAAAGPSFSSEQNVSLDIYDVAPTLLHAAGRAVPTDVSGRIHPAVLSSHNQEADVSTREPIKPRQTMDDISESDHERINERLRQLGYLE